MKSSDRELPPEHLAECRVSGIPEADAVMVATLRSRLIRHVTEFLNETKLREIFLTITNSNHDESRSGQPTSRKNDSPRDSDEISIAVRAQQYEAQEALYNFDFVVLPCSVRDDLLSSVHLVEVRHLVFEEWNLKAIEPFPQIALNFHGPPGTGKTLAAHAVARKLNQKIIAVSYAQIESKFHGDGPKNVEAVFFAAERDGAVLFIDEADSLLSKRLTNVQQGSEQAINSMRSQLLICLGRFSGTVIFATNLVENYDKAFESRVRHIRFDLPDRQAREIIWEKHLVAKLPKAPDVSVAALAAIDGICGRDIKNAVVEAALRAAYEKRDRVSLRDLTAAIERIVGARPTTASPAKSEVRPLTSAEARDIESELSAALDIGDAGRALA